MITPESSNECPWISIWRLAKPQANHCVVILKARWLRPTFAESYRFYVWVYQKNLWLFMFEMHLISGITDGWQGCEPPRPAKCKNRAPTLDVFWSGDVGFLYSHSMPDLLLFLNYFLSVSQWAPFSKVSPWLKPLVTSLHLIKARLYCRQELCARLAAVSYNESIFVS